MRWSISLLPCFATRMATVLMYLSEPEEGGETVFPKVECAPTAPVPLCRRGHPLPSAQPACLHAKDGPGCWCARRTLVRLRFASFRSAIHNNPTALKLVVVTCPHASFPTAGARALLADGRQLQQVRNAGPGRQAQEGGHGQGARGVHCCCFLLSLLHAGVGRSTMHACTLFSGSCLAPAVRPQLAGCASGHSLLSHDVAPLGIIPAAAHALPDKVTPWHPTGTHTQGDAVLFWSIKPDGRFDPGSLHGSCPVIKARHGLALCSWGSGG